jgi:hypothetical protein
MLFCISKMVPRTNTCYMVQSSICLHLTSVFGGHLPNKMRHMHSSLYNKLAGGYESPK